MEKKKSQDLKHYIEREEEKGKSDDYWTSKLSVKSSQLPIAKERVGTSRKKNVISRTSST